MPRKHWKQPISFSLAKDVVSCLRDLERGAFKGISRTSIVEQAILYLHAKHFPERYDFKRRSNAQEKGQSHAATANRSDRVS